MPPGTISQIEVLIGGLVHRGTPLATDQLTKISATIAQFFSVKPSEVAILTLTPDGKSLRFRVPEQLQKVGCLPLNSSSALAARTAREKRAEILNNFSIVPHASVFEAVRLESGHGAPIQKIMSVPVMSGAKALGVLQVSRKASTMKGAPDFTPRDLQHLVSIAALLPPALALCEE